MEKTVEDKVFGTIVYKHRWERKIKLNYFENSLQITLAIKAYSGKDVTQAQRDSYQKITDSKHSVTPECFNKVLEKVQQYVNNNIQDLSEGWLGAKKIAVISDLKDIISPKTLLIKQDGEVLFLFNCSWDEEHGIAVRYIPELDCGPQDNFL